MSDERIKLNREGHILHIQLNRPEKKNAIDNEMYRGLIAALEDAARDDTVTAVILSGAGDSFTAGNDLKSFLAISDISIDMPAPAFLKALSLFPKILIAAVHGAAVGIGTTLLLHCDIVIAAHGTRFQLPFINLGLVPEAASSLLLPARIGYVKAAELLLFGDVFDAKTAHELGLVNRVVEQTELEETARVFADRLKGKSLFALLETKRLLKLQSAGIEAHMEEEFKSFGSCLAMPEFKAAAAKFFEAKK